MLLRRLVLAVLCASCLSAADDPLAAPPELKMFAKEAAGGETAHRLKLQALVNAIHKPISEGGMGVQYDNSYTRTVAEVWRDRKANCLSLTALYVACATTLDFRASFAEAQNTQRWRRVGKVIRYERHVVALVQDFPRGDMVADFLPQVQKRWGTYIVNIISEARLRALFHSNRSVELMEAGDLAGAMAQAELSLKDDPGSSVGWNILGVVQRAQGNVKEAEASYLKAHRIDPKDMSCIGNLENLYKEQGKEEESATYRRLSLKLRQQDPYFHAFLADEALAAGELDEALRRIHQALKIQAYEPEFHLIQARIHLSVGKLDEAVKDIENARRWAQPGERERYDSKLAILRQRAAQSDSALPPAEGKAPAPLAVPVEPAAPAPKPSAPPVAPNAVPSAN
jgi:Flp pilus assembly protein TadD